jgi:hypothetical protein
MAKISLAGFMDPVRRPRYIIWTGVAVLIFAAFMVTVLGITSTRWFCAEGCHKVQDDTIVAYNHSTHSQISCMSCHMPVNANPVVFLLHKAEALGELAQTVTNNYELPLNGEDEVALTMSSDQCNQCHNINNRKVSPDPGIKIDHQVHIAKGIQCTICHNRIAHNEDFTLQLTDPKTKQPNKKHPDFSTMTACFRCHDQDKNEPAPGTCSVCHTPGFQLKPASHLQADFFPAKHGELAKEALAEVQDSLKETGDKPVTAERKAEWLQPQQGSNEATGERLIPVAQVFYCGTCHAATFCTDCHGTPMPHSDEFKNPKSIDDPNGHPALSKTIADKCVMCHTKANPNFCNDCHHGKQIGFAINDAQPWVNQHPAAVEKEGLKACWQCHQSSFCADCHTSRKVFPTSHRAANWVHSPIPTVTQYSSVAATPTAAHALAALESTETCSVCHGPGGTSAPFCMNCHKLPMPHPVAFKTTPGVHRTEGLKNPAVCKNCHNFPELCSNCHHIGSSTNVAWKAVHGGQVESHGASTCSKCHADKSFCQDCHQANKVKPASHNQSNFLRVPNPGLAVHAALYEKDSSICSYCHAGDPASLPKSAFCMNCHKLEMPHPEGWGLKDPSASPAGDNGGQHADYETSHGGNTAVCSNCHEVTYCDSCHHKSGYQPGQNWLKIHPNQVNKAGAASCYDNKNGGTTGCHNEQFCSACHVNRAAALKKAGL